MFVQGSSSDGAALVAAWWSFTGPFWAWPDLIGTGRRLDLIGTGVLDRVQSTTVEAVEAVPSRAIAVPADLVSSYPSPSSCGRCSGCFGATTMAASQPWWRKLVGDESEMAWLRPRKVPMCRIIRGRWIGCLREKSLSAAFDTDTVLSLGGMIPS